MTDPQAEPTWSPECGALVPEAGPSRLTVAGRFAATADASGQVLTGTVEVSVPTGADPISGVIAPEAFAFLVRDRRVLTEPLPQDTVGELVELAPGRSVVVPARASLARCAAAGGPVEPGGYEVWALMTVTGDDGTAVQALGGPWPVDVR